MYKYTFAVFHGGVTLIPSVGTLVKRNGKNPCSLLAVPVKLIFESAGIA